MQKDINIIIANPAGNTTVFVMDKFERDQYQKIATQLLAHEEYNAEQVAFVTGQFSMEMCGLEFCGNASRTFGLLCGRSLGAMGKGTVNISVSGVNELLPVEFDTTTNYTKIKMPMAESVSVLKDTGIDLLEGATLVNFGGIVHLILNDIEASDEHFQVAKDYIEELISPPATGVMFFDTKSKKLVPIVYVKDVDSTYYEGSCGSGSTAVAIAEAMAAGVDRSEDISYDIIQPAGTITTTVAFADEQIKAVYIEGEVPYSELMTATVEI